VTATKYFLAAGIALAIAPAAAAAVAEIEPGLWEVTVNTSGVMGMGKNTYVSQQCLKAEDLVKPEDFTPDMVMPEMKCTKQNFTQNGNTLNWEATCTGYGIAMAGTGTYVSKGSQAYEGVVHMKMRLEGMPNLGGAGVVSTTTYSGRRLGACTE
jgi:Protein of unknown function (DUF3617)